MPPIPDTALDWADLPGLQVRAASCRGHLKRYEGEPRQDSYALGRVGEYLIAAVADGVGSARLSHLGASYAAAAAVGGVQPTLSSTAEEVRGDRTDRVERLDAIAAALQLRAAQVEADAAELSTTLLIAAIPLAMPQDPRDGTDAVLWQIGDSQFGRIDGDGLHMLDAAAEEDAGLSSTAVDALPGMPQARVWVERLAPGECLVLMTDGVSNPAALNHEYGYALASLWQGAAPTPAGLLEVLDASIRSFDDDRTLLGIRFGEEGINAHR